MNDYIAVRVEHCAEVRRNDDTRVVLLNDGGTAQRLPAEVGSAQYPGHQQPMFRAEIGFPHRQLARILHHPLAGVFNTARYGYDQPAVHQFEFPGTSAVSVGTLEFFLEALLGSPYRLCRRACM